MRRSIGRTGVEVFAIGLGGMPMSIQGRPDERQSLATLKAAFEGGVNFIDTADVYCHDDSDIGHNERLIARALRLFEGQGPVYVATKGGLRRPRGNWVSDGRPQHLREACERSLEALGVESIFLYQLHAPDPRVLFEDSIGELERLKEEGKIQHVGLSNIDAGQLSRAQSLMRIESVQNRANLFDPDDFRIGLTRLCETQGVTYLAYSPVGGARKHPSFASHPVLQRLATLHRTSPYCVALSWLLHQSPTVIPIPGASKPTSIRDSIQAVHVHLSADELRELDGLRPGGAY